MEQNYYNVFIEEKISVILEAVNAYSEEEAVEKAKVRWEELKANYAPFLNHQLHCKVIGQDYACMEIE